MSRGQAVELNLVVIFSPDIHASRDFYRCLGLSFQEEQHGSGPVHYSAQVGRVVLEIYPLADGSPIPSIRIGFRVDGVDDVVASLRDRGVSVRSGPKDSPWGRRAVVEDPDGNRVELTQTN